MKRYNLSRLMKKAWQLFKAAANKAAITFSMALKKAWMWERAQAANAVKIEEAAKAAGLGDMVYHSWAGWQSLGRMVMHESVAAFKVEVDDPTTKSGKRIKSFFLYEDTQPTPQAA